MVTTAAVEYTQKEKTFLPCKKVWESTIWMQIPMASRMKEGDRKKICGTETQGIPSSE